MASIIEGIQTMNNENLLTAYAYSIDLDLRQAQKDIYAINVINDMFGGRSGLKDFNAKAHAEILRRMKKGE